MNLIFIQALGVDALNGQINGIQGRIGHSHAQGAIDCLDRSLDRRNLSLQRCGVFCVKGRKPIILLFAQPPEFFLFNALERTAADCAARNPEVNATPDDLLAGKALDDIHHGRGRTDNRQCRADRTPDPAQNTAQTTAAQDGPKPRCETRPALFQPAPDGTKPTARRFECFRHQIGK